MNGIIFPHCNKAFKIDESGFADIHKQGRDRDIKQQLNKRLRLADNEKASAFELAQEKAAGELQKAAAAKDPEIQTLKAELGKVEEACSKLEASHQSMPERKSLLLSEFESS